MLRIPLILAVLMCGSAALAQDQTTNRLQGNQPAAPTTNNLQNPAPREPTTTNLATDPARRKPTTTDLQQGNDEVKRPK